MIQSFNKTEKVSGSLTLPGDKSISHRALILAALANGESEIANLPKSDDINSTINCLQQIGIQTKEETDCTKLIGVGFKGFKKPNKPLNAENSGTTARLLSGILSAQRFDSVIEGDESLSKRPMLRIIKPLKMMGARISGSKNNTLPIRVFPSDNLHSINYELPIPSAQVKSAILLTGLHTEEKTKVIEFTQTRDHTERMLGLDVEKSQLKSVISVSKKNYPVARKYFIPGDFSTAAYFILLALLSKNANLTVLNISLNSSRIRLLELLKKMGAGISVVETGVSNGEPFGNINVMSSELTNIKINDEIIPGIIDEIPILAIVGIFSEGDFEIRCANELRVKESDRISALCYNLSLLGLTIEEYEDGFKIWGEIKNKKPLFNSFGDHRIAMTFAILSCLLDEGGKVDGFECVSVSNPEFLEQLKSVTS